MNPTPPHCPCCGARVFTVFHSSPVRVDLDAQNIGHSPCEEQTEIFCASCGVPVYAEQETLWDAIYNLWEVSEPNDTPWLPEAKS